MQNKYLVHPFPDYDGLTGEFITRSYGRKETQDHWRINPVYHFVIFFGDVHCAVLLGFNCLPAAKLIDYPGEFSFTDKFCVGLIENSQLIFFKFK